MISTRLTTFQPETVDQLKFTFFPDIWAPRPDDKNSDYVWHRFPNGRRRREIRSDPLTGQLYESYDGAVNQISDLPLKNDTSFREGANAVTMDDEDDEFDDQFEEDLLEQKMWDDVSRQRQDVEIDADEPDLSSSRWDAYEALSQALQRYTADKAKF